MRQSPAVARFLVRLKPELASSFTREQLEAVEMHFGMRYRVNHVIDWRTRIRLPFLKFYLVVLAGNDSRQAE